MKLDIFKLDDPNFDISPKSWICFKGNGLRDFFIKVVEEVIKQRNISKKDLFDMFSKRFCCSSGPLAEILYIKKEWIPLPFIKYVISLSKKKVKYKEKVIYLTKFIKCNTSNSKEIKAIKNITINLCKICGAHAADGNIFVKLGLEIKNKNVKKKIINLLKENGGKFSSISTKGRSRILFKIEDLKLFKKLELFRKNKDITFFVSHGFNIAEGYKSHLVEFQKWFFESFGVKPKIKEYKYKNAYRLDIDNKIVARYLHKFFGFPLGKKTYDVKEPKSIKNSGIKFRKAFLSAFMTFEGHVRKQSYQVEVSSKSSDLIKSVYEIFQNLQIPMRELHQDNYGRWLCISQSLNKNNITKTLSLFEKNTEKWNRLYGKLENARL